MDIAILIFDGITALDAVGPYEVLQRLPGATTRFVGHRVGEVRTDNRALGLMVDHVMEDVAHPELVLIPGGFGTRRLVDDSRALAWIRGAHATSRWTTSVCTGALVLAAAGVLADVPATTHWMYLDELGRRGARPVSQRIAWHGKIVTAAGVSAGIDMALALAARISSDDVARAIQLGIEYDPQPPFDCGAPAKAPVHVVDAVRARIKAFDPATDRQPGGEPSTPA